MDAKLRDLIGAQITHAGILQMPEILAVDAVGPQLNEIFGSEIYPRRRASRGNEINTQKFVPPPRPMYSIGG